MGILSKIGAATGSLLGSAFNSSSGSKAATRAQLKAIEDAKGALGDSYGDIKGYLAPGLSTYQPGVNALTSRLGLSTVPPPASGGAPLGQPGAGGGGGSGVFDNLSPAARSQMDLEDAYWAKSAARDAGTMGSRPADGAIDMTAGPDGVYDAAPGGGNALTQPGTYGNETNPVAPGAYSTPDRPGGFSFNVNDFVNSPILQASLRRGTAAAEGSAAARGSLFSGATLKALTDYGLDSSYKFFNNERDFAYGMNRDEVGDWRDERDFGYGMSRDNRRDFEDKRNYLTGRFDRGTEDLFRYTGIGERAAGGASNAAQRYGEGVAGLITDAGEAKATNALTQANVWNDFGANLAAAISRGMGRN